MAEARTVASFLGVDLGWYGKPAGLAWLVWDGERLRQRESARLQGEDAIARWIAERAGDGPAAAGVDAPIEIRNESGTRLAEKELNRDFRRYHAGCHAANLGLPFAGNVLSFSKRLSDLGFAHGGETAPRPEGRFQIEVHPHAASVSLFGLGRILKAKRGRRAGRDAGLRALAGLLRTRLPSLDPPFEPELPEIPASGPLKPAEDRIDAVLCAYIAAHWWWWGSERNRVYGAVGEGRIVVPAGPSR